MTVIAIASQKGGTGKTTVTVNLGVALQKLGRSVLLVDVDPQASLTTYAGCNEQVSGRVSLADALASQAMSDEYASPRAADLVERSPLGVDLVPTGRGLADAEAIMLESGYSETILGQVLAPVRGKYDYILLDCPPGVGLLTVNGLAAADSVLVPTQPDYLAVKSLGTMLGAIASTKVRLSLDLEILGVFVNMGNRGTRHYRQMVEAVGALGADGVRVFQTTLDDHVAVKEASRLCQSVVRCFPHDGSAGAYLLLAREVDALTLAHGAISEVPTIGDARGAGRLGAEAQPSDSPTQTEESNFGRNTNASECGSPEVGHSVEAQEFCTFLGLGTSPTDRMLLPCDDHRCFAVTPPMKLSMQVQRKHCLEALHRVCPRFFRQLCQSNASVSYGEKEGGIAGRARRTFLPFI